MEIANRITSLRVQLCPRTSYATAGSAASTLFIVHKENDQKAKEATDFLSRLLPDLKEFEQCQYWKSFKECQPNVELHVLLLINPNASDIPALKSVLLDGKSKLCLILYTAKRKCPPNIKDDFESASLSISEFEFENAALTAFYVANDTVSDTASMVGFNGQPSVQSNSQFRYLWDTKGLDTPTSESRQQAKLRVLQRLSDHEQADQTKLPPEEWDRKIQSALQKGLTDWQIYSMIRKITLGRSLDEELSGTNITFISSSHTGGGEGDGRAEHLVDLTIKCLPTDIQSNPSQHIKKMLDYGCAEGAITAEIGKRLKLDASSIFGADVRAITAHDGYTFMQLPVESSDGAVEVLPQIEEESLDFVNAAMVFHHVTYIEKVVKELHSKISSTGLLLIREHDCHDEAMAAMLDITHGLYSLAWSTPIEWPDFIKEYKAFYRSREDWDAVLARSGFKRFEDPMNDTAVFQYNAAVKSVYNERKGKFPNVIRAYYAVYRKDVNDEGHEKTKKRGREETAHSGFVKKSKVRFVKEGENRYVVMESKTNPGKYYLLDTATGTSTWI